MSLKSTREEQLSSIKLFSKGLSEYFLSGQLQIRGTEFEQQILHSFETFARLKQTGLDPTNPYQKEFKYRYDHTLMMLEQLSAVMRQDYRYFIRLDQKAIDRGENTLTSEQADQIRERFYQVLHSPQKRRLMAIMIISHDYGCLYDFPTHFVISGQVCQDDFEKQGFQRDMNLARLVVGNHSYFGDLLLGEGSLDYIWKLKKEMAGLNVDFDQFWHYLWTLNLLDINASKGGFLSAEKYQELGSLYNSRQLEDLETDFHEKKLAYLLGVDESKYLVSKGLINKGFSQVYSQYFNFLINQQVFDTDDRAWLINTVTNFWLKAGSELDFNYLAFTSDTELAAKKLLEVRQKTADTDMFDLKNRKFLGFDFVIENGYLRIDLGSRY